MNKLNLNKALAAGLFAATIITITACGGGGGSSASGSTKINTIAGGGNSTTGTEATQAALGFLNNLVVKDGNFIFNASRDGAVKQLTLNLATNQLSDKAYSNIGAEESISYLISANDDKYYFWVTKSIASSRAYALYDATSGLVGNHIAGQKVAGSSSFAPNDNGKLASFKDPKPQAVFYKDGTTDQLFFIDDNKIRKVTLSGSYPTTTVNDSPKYNPGSIALSGDKLIVTSTSSFIIFEHDLKNNTAEKVIAGSSFGYENAEKPEQAMLKYPSNITISPSGNIYFSVPGVKSASQKIIRKLAVNNGVYGAVTTAFGAAPDSTADNAELSYIYDLEFIGNNLYVVDAGDDGNVRIKKIEFINQTP